MGSTLRMLVLALLATTGLAGYAAAQQGAVAGRVLSSDGGTPLNGAQVEIMNASGAVGNAIADATGSYRVANIAPGTYRMVVTSVGYTTKRVDHVEVGAGQTAVVNVSMSPSAINMGQIVVTGVRDQKGEKIVESPSRVSVVSEEEIEIRPAVTPVDHLRSTPGLDVATSGIQSTNVVARGFNNVFSGSLHTLTDNRIAGVPSLRVNLMHFIPSNNEDIERMEVVLGPGAALYGPNTADGVLHIMTKSPLTEPGTVVSVAGGTQDMMHVNFRTAHRLSETFGLKVSGQYLTATEFEYRDPVEISERDKFAGANGAFLRQDLIRILTPQYGAGAQAEADRRIERIAARDFAVDRWSGEVRADWQPSDELSTVFSLGSTMIGNGIELTGLGAGMAQDWRYSYAQARMNYKRLFAQLYVNASDAGETFLLRNGAPISDRSRLYVGQIQHGFDLSDRQSLTYGLDYFYTNPVTDGTINGSYEDDDQTTEVGAYLQSKTALSGKFDLVLAGRVDDHSALPEMIFSPRAALVFKAADDQSFRLTYNRAFSTPSSLNQYLDLSSAMPSLGAAQLGYSIRVQGTGDTGFHFRQSDGSYRMLSPFTPEQFGGAKQRVPVDATSYWAAAVGVVAAQAAAKGQAMDPQMVNYLMSLTPTSEQIASNFMHPETGAMGRVADLELPDLDPIRESTTTTFEAGYTGVLGQKLLLAADVYYTKQENFVTPLTLRSPFILLNPETTAGYLTQRFMQDMGWDQATAQATAVALTQGLAAVPLGVIAPDEMNATGAQLLTTYTNVDDALEVWGTDLSATAMLTDRFSMTGTLSLVNDNVFETREGSTVTLNAPKTKGSLSAAYRNPGFGLSTEVRARFNEEFPVRSGVYNGTLCIDGQEPGAEPCVDAFTLFDAALDYRLRYVPGASVQLSVQNLLDEEYRSFAGVPTIGRMALLRLRYEF